MGVEDVEAVAPRVRISTTPKKDTLCLRVHKTTHFSLWTHCLRRKIEWHGILRCVSIPPAPMKMKDMQSVSTCIMPITSKDYILCIHCNTSREQPTFLIFFGVWSSHSRNPNIMGTQIPMDGWPSDSNNATGLTTTGRFSIHVSLVALHTFCSAGGVRRIGNDQIVEVGEIPSSVNRPRQSPVFQVFHFHGATWELNHGTETLQGFGYLTMDKSASQISRKVYKHAQIKV